MITIPTYLLLQNSSKNNNQGELSIHFLKYIIDYYSMYIFILLKIIKYRIGICSRCILIWSFANNIYWKICLQTHTEFEWMTRFVCVRVYKEQFWDILKSIYQWLFTISLSKQFRKGHFHPVGFIKAIGGAV